MTFNKFAAVVLCFGAFAMIIVKSNGKLISFENYRVYTVSPSKEEHWSVLSNLENQTEDFIFLDDINFHARNVNTIVAPHKVIDFLATLDKNGIFYDLVEENVQKKLDEVEIRPQLRANGYGWTSYYKFDETQAWLKSLPRKYPRVLSLFTVGQSYEGRTILGVKISYRSNNPGIFVEGGIHAREWISPTTVTFFINELLTSQNGEIRRIAQNYNWYLVPHVNPDGYVYTHTTNRMWRKTRSYSGRSGCYGADANRNFDINWNRNSPIKDPCSDIYPGLRAFSEIEIQWLGTYLMSIRNKIHLYISFHNYGQILLYPYGYTNAYPSNNADLRRIAYAATSAIRKRYGSQYTYGNIYHAIYPASGSSIDWVYDYLGVKLAFAYELRPKNDVKSTWNGFNLPSNEIIPVGRETLDSVIAMINEGKRLNYFGVRRI